LYWGANEENTRDSLLPWESELWKRTCGWFASLSSGPRIFLLPLIISWLQLGSWVQRLAMNGVSLEVRGKHDDHGLPHNLDFSFPFLKIAFTIRGFQSRSKLIRM
jgi:hypothetical protein